jgi:hypothetical protein
MTKKEDRKALIETILLYKEKIRQTPGIKTMIQKLQQKLDKLNDKRK